MSPEQKLMVQTTFERLSDDTDALASLFFARVSELSPALKAVFRGNSKELRLRFSGMLALAVKGLDRVADLLTVAAELGRSLGLKESDYEAIGVALIWTLEQTLKEEFTPSIKRAWTSAYGLLSDTMRRASAGSPSARHAA